MKIWNAVVLAGDRGVNDPVAKAAGVKSKAVVKFQEKTLLERVVSALYESSCINKIFTMGPSKQCLLANSEIKLMLERFEVTNLAPKKGPCASALQGVIASGHYPVLIITSDLPFLESYMIEEYCHYLDNVEADFAAGAINYASIAEKLPALKKTKYHFEGQAVCFANLFAVLNVNGLKAIEYWQDIENSRKRPLDIVRKIDWLSVFRYKLGKLSLDQAALKLSQKVDAHLVIENLTFPELAIDVDSAHDYSVLKKHLE